MGAPGILIVEDDIMLARHVKLLLERTGYTVVSIQTDGDSAVEACRLYNPDVILMDIALAGKADGIETAAAISAQYDIPVIFLTSSTDHQILQRASSIGAYGFLVKPCQEHDLRAAIEVGLSRHAMQLRVREQEQWLSAVVNCIDDAVVGTDHSGRIRLFNRVASMLTGYSESEALGQPIDQIVRYRCSGEEYAPELVVVSKSFPEGSELYTRHGAWIPIEGTMAPVQDAADSSGMAVIFRDISKRKAAKARLQQSEERYRAVIHQSPDCIFLVDFDTQRVVEANAAMARLLGYSNYEMHGLELVDITTSSRETVLENMQRIRSENIHELGERVYRRKDGALVDVEVRASLVSYLQKTLLCVMVRDITERKRIQRELTESESRFRLLYEHAPVMMHSADECDVIRNVNQKWLSVMGYSRDEVIGRPVLDFFAVSDAARARDEVFPQCWERGFANDVECQLVRRDGGLIDVMLSSTVVPDPVHSRISLAVLQDITEQKRAKEELIVSQKKYSELIRNVPIAIMRFLIADNKYEFVNNAFERQSGYSLNEVELLNDNQLVDMIHEKDRYRVFSAFRAWQQDNYRDVQHLAYRIINKQGHIVWLDSYMYADLDEHGLPVALNQICVDITGLKKAEKALSDTLREDFRRTVQNLQNLVIKLYRLPDGDYAYSLREGKLAGDLTTNAVRGRTPFEIYGDAHDALVRPYIMRAFAGESISFEMELDNKWFFYSLEPVIEDGRVEEVVGSAVDITPQKNTERLLRQSEQNFRVLVENLPVAIVQSFVYPNGQVQMQYVNPQYERNTGYSIDEQINMSPYERLAMFHPEDRDSLVQAWLAWQEPSSPVSVKHLSRLQHKSGEYRWVDNHAIRYAVGDGRFAIIEALLDVTEQKLSEERLRRLASFPEQDPNPIVEIDLEGAIRYVNPRARVVFPDVEMLGVHHPVLQWVQSNIPALLVQPDRVLSREIELHGEVFEQAVLYLPEVALVRVFFYTITERKHAEEQLRKALAKERELGNLKTRFVTTVSHEFRTPLTGILMSAEILDRYSERMSEPERRQEVDKIKKRVHELTDLMNDFLLQSSAESLRTTFNPVPVNIAAVCADVVHEHQPAAHSAYVPLECRIDSAVPVVYGDPKLLRLVVQNLVSNALKFSGENAPVSVQLSYEKDHVVLLVRDCGIGIPPGEIASLFTPFYRASNAARIPGTGIGLSIVKEFVELHSGTIRVQSDYGKGTVFTVVLPVHPMPRIGSEQEDDQVPANKEVGHEAECEALCGEQPPQYQQPERQQPKPQMPKE